MSEPIRVDENVSRRKFLGRSATAGSALIVGAAASVSCAAQDGNKTSNSSSTPKKMADLQGEMVEYKSAGLMIPAYLSRPKKQGPAPGAVLVIHEVFGLNDHIKSIADRIANEGYVALAPNLFIRAPEPPPKDTSDFCISG